MKVEYPIGNWEGKYQPLARSPINLTTPGQLCSFESQHHIYTFPQCDRDLSRMLNDQCA
jgi:hypothetical protein